MFYSRRYGFAKAVSIVTILGMLPPSIVPPGLLTATATAMEAPSESQVTSGSPAGFQPQNQENRLKCISALALAANRLQVAALPPEPPTAPSSALAEAIDSAERLLEEANLAVQSSEPAEAAQLYSEAAHLARTVMAEDANAPEQVLAVRLYCLAATGLGVEEEIAVAADLQSLVDSQPPSILTWTVRNELAYYHHRRNNNPGRGFIEYMNALGDYDESGVERLRVNPDIDAAIRARVELYIADAYYNTGRRQEALSRYEVIASSYSPEVEAFHDAALNVGFILGHLNNEFEQGIAYLDAFIASYPHSPKAGEALIQIANFYVAMDEYALAKQAYQAVTRYFPSSTVGRHATVNLAYLEQHLLGTRVVYPGTPYVIARGERDIRQICGPLALQVFLRIEGTECDIQELTALAGTTSDGSTMAGLLRAAAAKGLTLHGVQSNDPTVLPTPFIAYVDSNHYVLVLRVTESGVSISDSGKPPEDVPLSTFLGRWGGHALTKDGGQQVAHAITMSEMAQIMGGVDLNAADCPNHHGACDDPCLCGDGSGGGGAGSGGGECGDGGGGGGVSPGIDGGGGTDGSDGSAGSPGSSGSGGGAGGGGGGGPGSPGTPGTPGTPGRPGEGPQYFPRSPAGGPSTPDDDVHVRIREPKPPMELPDRGGCTGGFTGGPIPCPPASPDNGTPGAPSGQPDGSPGPNGGGIGGGSTSLTLPGPASEAGLTPYQGSQQLIAVDLSLNIRGPMEFAFKRYFHNPWGYYRGEYYDSPMGRSWSHNFQQHLVVTEEAPGVPPDGLVYYDHLGNANVYFLDLATVNDDFQRYDPSDRLQRAKQTSYLLRNDSTGAFVLYVPSELKYEFSAPDVNETCRLEAKEDARGNRITLEYSLTGRLQRVYPPSGDDRYLEIMYHVNKIETVAIMQGTPGSATELQHVAFEYANNQLRTFTDTDGETVDYLYDTQLGFNISSITDKKGRTVTYDYTYEYISQELGYQVTEIEVGYPNGLRTVCERVSGGGWNDGMVTNLDAQDNVLSKLRIVPGPQGLYPSAYEYFIDPNDTDVERWEYEYYDYLSDSDANNDHELWRIKGPDFDPQQENYRLTYTYNANGRIASVQVGSANPQTIVYDNDGMYPVSVTSPSGLVTEYEYNAYKQITKEVTPINDPDGHTLTYNSYGELITLTGPGGQETHYTYDVYGNMDSVSNDALEAWTFTQDALGRRLTSTNPNNETTQFEYDDGACGSCGGSAALKSITDPQLNETVFEYDENGNLTAVTDPASGVTSFEYDVMDGLVKVVHPAGSQNEVEYEYDLLGRMTRVIDFNGEDATIEYDHMGRARRVTDAEGFVELTYDTGGDLTEVADSGGTISSYEYNENHWLTRATDAEGKVVEYEFDPDDGTLVRMVAKASALGAEEDPVEFVFDETTGILTQYKYGPEGYSDDVTLTYNTNMELTSMTDWLGTKEYEYNAIGQLTKVIDYNDAETSFTYDDAGQVLTMTDTHGGVTTAYSYTYTANGQVATITSPGNKLWEFEYNDLGQPTVMTYPNGMVKEWGYDARDRLTSLVYRDEPLGNVLASYTYVLDELFNVLKMTEADGTFWDYGYDDRYRLTSAVRNNAAETIQANYAYTYDASDNMLTKVEPFEDGFNDTNYTGWTPLNSSYWQVADGALKTVVQGWNHVMEKQFADADYELTFDYRSLDTSSAGYYASAMLRQTSTGGRVAVYFYPDRAELQEYVPGTGWVVRGTEPNVDTAEDEWYHVKAVCDGSSIVISRWQDGEMPVTIFDETTTYLDTWRMMFVTATSSEFAFDNVRILADDLSTTSTFTVNDADELVSMAVDTGGTTYYEYDAWGRMVRKYMGTSGSPTFEATYEYKYDDKLVGVESDFPDEGDVSYTYGADGQRRSRTAGGVTTKYNWGVDGLLSSEDVAGNLTETYLVRVAQIVGTDPNSGSYYYPIQEMNGTWRTVKNASLGTIGKAEFSPHGVIRERTGVSPAFGYTGHQWDDCAKVFYAVARYYSPTDSRWLSREPLGIDGPNLYWYALGNPVTFRDFNGLMSIPIGDDLEYNKGPRHLSPDGASDWGPSRAKLACVFSGFLSKDAVRIWAPAVSSIVFGLKADGRMLARSRTAKQLAVSVGRIFVRRASKTAAAGVGSTALIAVGVALIPAAIGVAWNSCHDIE